MNNIKVFPAPSGEAKDQSPEHAIYMAQEEIARSGKKLTGTLVLFVLEDTEAGTSEMFSVMSGREFGSYAATVGRLEIAKMALILDD